MMKKLLVLTLLISSNAIAAGFYYPVPESHQPLQCLLTPANIVHPQNYYIPSAVYIMQPHAHGIIRGVPPVFVSFNTGRVLPRGEFRDED